MVSLGTLGDKANSTNVCGKLGMNGAIVPQFPQNYHREKAHKRQDDATQFVDWIFESGLTGREWLTRIACRMTKLNVGIQRFDVEAMKALIAVG